MSSGNATSCSPVPGATHSSLAPSGYREGLLGVFVVFIFLIVLSLVIFVHERQRSGRLAKRSITLIALSCISAIFSCFVVLYREYYGRENFPCLAVLVIHHLVIPLVAGPLVAKVYVHAYRLRRSQITAGLSFAAVKKEQERIDRGEAKPGQGLVQNMSAFVTLQGKPTKSMLETEKDQESHDNFEMVSPVMEEPFDIEHDDDKAEPAKKKSFLQKLSPIRQPSGNGLTQRQESTGSEDLAKTSSRQSWVEMSPPNPTNGKQPETSGSPSPKRPSRNMPYPSSPAASSPVLSNSKSTRQSRTEDVVRKYSRNSSTATRRESKRMSSVGGIGWWSPRAQELESMVRLDELIKNESTLWGLFMVILFALPFVVVIVIRALTDSNYRFECTGCDFSSLDILIQCGLVVFMFSIFSFSIFVMWNAPDPLGIIWEAKLCVAMFFILGVPTVILYLLDPMKAEANYTFTWLAFENVTVVAILLIQTIGQVAVTKYVNRRVPKNISLLRLLENVELRDLFDDHLASEFSIENLRFWDRAIHWKASYEDMPPEEIQRRAKDLYRIFVQREAAMALNLSFINLSKLQQAFAPGAPEPVPRTVFDEALKECFKLMNDGLSRFLVGEKYRKFVRHAPPDFEGDMLRNKEVGLDLNVSVEQYLKQLEGLQSRTSFTVSANGVLVNEAANSAPRKGSKTSIIAQFLSPGTSAKLEPSNSIRDEENGQQHHLSAGFDQEIGATTVFDEEKARPISMRVRKSVSYPDPEAAGVSQGDRRGSSYMVQVVPSQTLSSPAQQSGGNNSPNKSPGRGKSIVATNESSSLHFKKLSDS